ncbi:hypothetical protein HELRODRAFT_113705 [Helobdella robusta]|uniref:Uncharacterized protein n=1 Tax=Helobdella robusta TaxID=6412 RepID=T1EFV4_HELRO|nr:hypothetical protein HELRODRAFT_113705 [Helobdella robusta]ESN99626.1 hypothetical protein HELRODRAFT_113705 [Helobdella robusta]
MATKSVAVAKSDFPLYCIQMIGDSHFVVAGGGGSARTGVPNAMDIYEIKFENKTLCVNKVNHFETKSRAVMNCAVARQDKQFYLAAGLDNSCQLHTLRYKTMVPKNENEVLEGVRKRKNNLTNSANHNTAVKVIGFDLEPGDEIITDRSKDGFQKVVRFTHDIKYLLTAGADGYLRCWEFPSLKLFREVHCHTNEIDDMDCSFDNKHVVTVSKDNTTCLWSLKSGSKESTLQWKSEFNSTHRVRNCRFGFIKDKSNAYNLYTTHIPITRNKGKNSSCFIVKWETNNFTHVKQTCTGNEILSAIAISEDGIFLGVGTISGSVSVYISFSLQRLYHVASAHNIFVTGLEFAPHATSNRSGSGVENEFTLFSISADNHIKLHQQAYESSYSACWVFVGFCIIVLFILWTLRYLHDAGWHVL